ncbi:unnamed protein product, partial [Rotaria sordida]
RFIKEIAPISKIYDEEILKAEFSTELLASVPLARDIRNITFFETSYDS